MVLASNFVPERYLWILPLRDALWEVQIISPLCAPGHLQITVSTLFALWVVCLTSLQEQDSTLQTVSQPSLLIFKFPGFKPYWLTELKKLGLSHSPSHWLWGNPLIHFPVCTSLSHPSLDHSSFFCAAARIHFSPKPHPHTFCLLSCGLFFPFNCGGCSASLQVNFWKIWDNWMVIYFFVCGTRGA